jgi:superfamily I DNA/RNA helicase
MAYYEMIRGGHTPLRDMDDGFDKDRYARLIRAYEGYKKHNGLVDFTDCLLEFVARGEALPVKVAFIDEVQDLSLLMWNVCYTAFANAEKVYVAGDDFQSIYTYSGARPDILIAMAKNHKTVKLEVSYRLPKSVYRYAKAITNVIGNKMEKDYVPFKDTEGLVEFVNDRNYLSAMIEDRQKESWMLLFRNNVHMTTVEEDLRSRLIPYHTPRGFVVGEDDLGRIKKFYSFRLAGYKNEIQKEAFMKMYGITDFDDDFTESNLVYGNNKYYCLAYVEKFGLDALVKMSASKPAILVSTVHRVKGGEAKNVAFFCDCTRKVHRNRFRDFDSELRLLYVACTRTKENLYIVRSQSNYGLDDIIDALKEYNEL